MKTCFLPEATDVHLVEDWKAICLDPDYNDVDPFRQATEDVWYCAIFADVITDG